MEAEKWKERLQRRAWVKEGEAVEAAAAADAREGTGRGDSW